jgi:predicted Fe-S protein YdhL (DUF1289 family)
MTELLTNSPCIAVCRLDADGYCLGCRRSANEIAQWEAFTAEARDRVNRRILDQAHPAVRVRLLGEARGSGKRRGGRKRTRSLE